jgi:hypothetical protein
MGLPGLIGRALGLPAADSDAAAARLRQRVYAGRLARQLDSVAVRPLAA